VHETTTFLLVALPDIRRLKNTGSLRIMRPNSLRPTKRITYVSRMLFVQYDVNTFTGIHAFNIILTVQFRSYDVNWIQRLRLSESRIYMKGYIG